MNQSQAPVHAVITWVDGNDEQERAKREKFLAAETQPLNENATNPHRWENNNEIYFCLHSIHNHAPWIEKIWIVVGSSAPQLDSLPAALQRKINIVFHADIYRGYEDYLPTFNSVSIETLLWRIPGLSERYIYFNDDVFLTAPTTETDFFDGSKPVLRGGWRDYSHFVNNAELENHPAYFNHYMKLHAGQMLGFEPAHLYSNAHVAHPLLISVQENLFAERRKDFEENIKPRFRLLRQFQPIALHNHRCIQNNTMSFNKHQDHFHLGSGKGNDLAEKALEDLIASAFAKGIKQLCINDLPQLEAVYPSIRQKLRAAVGWGL